MNYYIDQDQNNESVMDMSKAFRTTCMDLLALWWDEKGLLKPK